MGRKTEVLGENSVPMPLCPPPNPIWTGLGSNPDLCGVRLVSYLVMVHPAERGYCGAGVGDVL